MARTFRKFLAYSSIFVIASLPLFFGLAKAQSVEDSPVVHAQLTTPDAETQSEIDECMGCHSAEAESGPVVDQSHLAKSPHASLGCKSCHASITEAPHTEAMLKEKPKCADCHPDESEGFQKSVHARKDEVKGDHPVCATCHGGGDPHSVKLYATWTREDKVSVCRDCHADKTKMARYGPNVNAVSSYEESFHGRALLKYGSQTTAICSDCHGTHAVLMPANPDSSTATNHVASTCAKCHPGAGPNFSVSGANHMNLTIDRDLGLTAVLMFFKLLVTGMATFLMLGVLLDLRRAIVSKDPPRAGRFISVMVALGFMGLVIAIVLATFAIPGGGLTAIIGTSLLLLSVLIYKIINPRRGPKPTKIYDRFNRSTRVQHMLLMISIVLLVITGMPIRNPQMEFLRQIYLKLGGLEVGRQIHRAAGALLIAVFVYHVLELLWKWKKAGFTWTSWTMLPNKKDISDFISETKSYLGQGTRKPKYGRFHFRGKLDYFAEYWGIPLMGITGLMLWFPVAFGNVLPPAAVPVAFIAHSYEAVLAFVAILTWHMYNSYFNPDHFASTTPWSIGKLSYEDMEHVHPLELEEVLKKEAPEEPLSD